MPSPRELLTPETFHMLETIARGGSFAAAARTLGLVPSALTYRVRQVEDALDVLLFDRRRRQARPTPAGAELLREGQRLLHEVDAVANRVKRIATGWEPYFTIAADGLVSRSVLLDLSEEFLSRNPPTQVRIRDEIMSGALEALTCGQADLAIGGLSDADTVAGMQVRALGEIEFVFAVAPRHPLAKATEPLPDSLIEQHRAVAVADSTRHGLGETSGLLPGQQVFTVSTIHAKLQAQLRGVGCGFLPLRLAQPYARSGQLRIKSTQRPTRFIHIRYGWRAEAAQQGHALQWWLAKLENRITQRALLQTHAVDLFAAQTPAAGSRAHR